MPRIGQLTNGNQFWQKVVGTRKGFNIAWIRTILINSCSFESKEIQEKLLLYLALQDQYIYIYIQIPKGFTEYFYHVGNANELNSMLRNGLIPGGVSLKTDRQAVLFTVNPTDNQDDWGETLCDLSKARIASYKNTWKHSEDTVFWCNLKLAQQRGLQFSQTRLNAAVLYDTLLAEFIEKAICMKTKDQI